MHTLVYRRAVERHAPRLVVHGIREEVEVRNGLPEELRPGSPGLFASGRVDLGRTVLVPLSDRDRMRPKRKRVAVVVDEAVRELLAPGLHLRRVVVSECIAPPVVVLDDAAYHLVEDRNRAAEVRQPLETREQYVLERLVQLLIVDVEAVAERGVDAVDVAKPGAAMTAQKLPVSLRDRTGSLQSVIEHLRRRMAVCLPVLPDPCGVGDKSVVRSENRDIEVVLLRIRSEHPHALFSRPLAVLRLSVCEQGLVLLILAEKVGDTPRIAGHDRAREAPAGDEVPKTVADTVAIVEDPAVAPAVHVIRVPRAERALDGERVDHVVPRGARELRLRVVRDVGDRERLEAVRPEHEREHPVPAVVAFALHLADLHSVQKL